MIVRKPFDFRGQVNRGNGWENYNGVVRRGWKVRLTKGMAKQYIKQRLVHKPVDSPKAYMVHLGGSWFEVRYKGSHEKIQGKTKAEARRDELNS
jgi:hypothetical protein